VHRRPGTLLDDTIAGITVAAAVMPLALFAAYGA
jgi:MFS superfamily sulfate permease-like transporter